jgi:hypothetical protein
MIECLFDQPELVRLLQSLGYEEYVFDETGLWRGKSRGAVNQIVMTERRARQVRLAPHGGRTRSPAYNAAPRLIPTELKTPPAD